MEHRDHVHVRGRQSVLGLPARWYWAVSFTAFCVLVECVLNIGGHLVWEYPFWRRRFAGIWLFLLFGYFEFFAAINLVLHLKTNRAKPAAVGIIYAVPVLMNVVGMGILGWTY